MSNVKCKGGWVITSDECPKCGATYKDRCGAAAGTTYFHNRPTESDRLRETQAVLVAALRSNLDAMRTTVERLDRFNRSHYRIDSEIVNTEAALARAEAAQ